MTLRHPFTRSTDTLFGSAHDGEVVFDIGAGDHVYDLAFDASERIILAGSADGYLCVARLEEDGGRDTGFNGYGWFADSRYDGSYLWNVAVGADGSILVGGNTVVVRLNVAGAPDYGFGDNGIVDWNATGQEITDVRALALFEDDGAITVIGQVRGASDIAVMRLAVDNQVHVVDVPAAPTNLVATTFSDTRIDLEWVDNSLDETRFVIERSLAGSNWITAASVPANSTTASITGLDPGHTYRFRVAADNTGIASAASAVERANTAVDDESQIDVVDTVNIPVDGSEVASTVTLEAGVRYRLTASGGAWIDRTYYPATGTYGYSGNAEYAYPNETVGSPMAEDALLGEDVGINVSGAQEGNVFWGKASIDRAYSIEVTGTGQPLTLHYRLPSSADPYPDPSTYNTLAVEISKITPRVWVESTGGDASEDNRTPATFTIHRTGSTSGSLRVYYMLGGTATWGLLDETGDPATDGMDYSGGTPDPENAGVFYVDIPVGAGSVDVVFTPVNDAEDEGVETIEATLVDSSEDEGSPGFYAPPATNDATTKPATTQKDQNDLKVAVVPLPADPNEPNHATVLDPLIGQLAANDPAVSADADAQLRQHLAAHPILKDYYKAKSDDVVDALPQTAALLRNMISSLPPIQVDVIGNRFQVLLGGY